MKEVKSPKKPLIFYYGIALLVIVLFNVIVSPLLVKARVTEVDYGTFMSMIEQKKIGNVEVEDDRDNLHRQGRREENLQDRRDERPDADSSGSTTPARSSHRILRRRLRRLVSFPADFCAPADNLHRTRPVYGQEADGTGGRTKTAMAFGFGKSNAKVYVPSTDGIRFSAMLRARTRRRKALAEIVDYLHNPKKYSDVGASMPKGVLLVGPPGTGKTMLAKAVAGEAGCALFLDVRLGICRNVRRNGRIKGSATFSSQAKEKAPCIVFIDEIDAIGKKRDGQIGGNDEREQTLNQLLTEMDGFRGQHIGVIISRGDQPPRVARSQRSRAPAALTDACPSSCPDLAGREAILKGSRKEDKDVRMMWISTRSQEWRRAHRARSLPTL